MIEVWDMVLLAVAGFGGGILAGMLGIGGGVIYVLIFSQFVQRFTTSIISDEHLVQLLVANSAFALVFAGIAGSIKQYRLDNFRWRPVLWIGIPGIATAILTTLFIEYHSIYSKAEFAVLFTLVMIPVILRMLFQENFKNRGKIKPGVSVLVATGLFSGLVTALSGLGGGFIVIPVLNGLVRIPIKRTISISLGVIALVAFGFSVFNLGIPVFDHYQLKGAMGAIVFPMVLPVVAGVLFGAPLGVRLSHRLSHRTIRITFVVFSLFTIGKIWYDFLF